jgi:hypothetical protein
MRKLFLALLLFLSALPAAAVIKFNAGDPMTTAASFAGSKRPPGGGVILHVSGTFDGASVALEVNGGSAWIAADTCEAMTAAQVCRAAIGPVDLRMTLSGVGAGTSISVVGFEAQAVVASSYSGGGATDWATIAGGASTEAFLIDTGGSLGPTGTGTVTATSAALASATTWASVSTPNVIHTPPGASGGFVFREFGGGTDAVRISHDGTNGMVASLVGRLDLDSPSGVFQFDHSSPNLRNDNGLGLHIINQGIFAQFAPGWGPDFADQDTLMYPCAANCIGLKAGNVGTLQVRADRVQAVGCVNFGKLSTAPSGAACDRYYDTDLQAWCTHNGTNWLDDFTGLVTCS